MRALVDAGRQQSIDICADQFMLWLEEILEFLECQRM